MRITREEYGTVAALLGQEEAPAVKCPLCPGAMLPPEPCSGCHFAGQHEHTTCSRCGAKFTNTNPAGRAL